MKIICSLILSCISLSGHLAMAQAPTPAPMQTPGGISFLSGGIGEEEAAEMKRIASDYNLRLLFAGKNGEYLANVLVRVENGQGVVILDAQSQGPYFFALLPGGSYRIHVSHEGQAQTRSVRLENGSGPELKFAW